MIIELLIAVAAIQSEAPTLKVATTAPELPPLAGTPAEQCEQGQLDVHVTERSSNRTAVVEFSMDPRAAGPGCFTV